MAHAFRLEGFEHEVGLSRAAAGYRLHIGDTWLPVSLAPRGEHLHELSVGDDRDRVFIARHGDDVHVHLDGEAYVLRHAHSLERFGARGDDDAEATVRAPMPGTVISTAVAAGDAVRRGQVLLVIESMKMETAIAALCDGTVQALHQAVGQTFDRDAPLVTITRGQL